MKTYLLTEKDVELLREKFCISKLQSDTLNEILSGLTSYTAFDKKSTNKDVSKHSFTKDIKEYKRNMTSDNIKKITEWVSGAKVAKKK